MNLDLCFKILLLHANIKIIPILSNAEFIIQKPGKETFYI